MRQRAWRALKASGAVTLRDGVYLMPERDKCRTTLDGLARDICNEGGSALVLRVEEPDERRFIALFDRTTEFTNLLSEISQLRRSLSADCVQVAQRQVRKLRKSFSAIAEIDFFPGEAQKQADTALRELELICARSLSPDEPQVMEGDISRCRIADYQGRIWATRQRPWVDRLASAWLIRRFIDPKAEILWLARPADCPANALGFDFDGAMFSHCGTRVTFEVLAASFGLEQPAIARLGLLVHYLDVGGVPPPEATGIECVLAGMRESFADDDQLMRAACTIFDALLTVFEKKQP